MAEQHTSGQAGTEAEAGAHTGAGTEKLHTETSAGNGAKDHGGGFPQLKTEDFAPQLVWLALTFVALYIIMSKVALPRIANVLEERRDRIASDIDRAEQLKSDTERAIASYEQALSDARGKAHAIAQEQRDKLKNEVDKERSEVEQQIAEKTADAESRIAVAKADAMSQVNAAAAPVTEDIVKLLIGKGMDESEIVKAVADAISGNKA